ncbi:MAG: hypothetical protein LBR65_10200 [Culturomica sp.]|jgi:nucleoid DNA-binding protein|nr:hypothetical protein [Culturomica sp.]
MHRFIHYISDLLFLHDCVILPDFGGFICNYRSACVDEATGTIRPPSKDILFNRNLTHNDGLLANWIVNKEDTSYDKAMKLIEVFCEELKVRLNQRQRVVFGDVGVFYTDRRFNIIFESGDSNFLADTYGMSEVEAPKVTVEGKREPRQRAVPSPTSERMSAYINMESGNWLHRSLKYGVAVAVIAGVFVVARLLSDVRFDNLLAGSPGSELFSFSAGEQDSPIRVNHTKVSPEYDYVAYDPAADL